MVTLQTFTTPTVFVEKMAERYQIPSKPEGMKEEVYCQIFQILFIYSLFFFFFLIS